MSGAVAERQGVHARALRRRRRRRRLALVTAVLLILGAVAGVFVLADRHQASRVPRGATIDGLDVGELTADDAVRLLRERRGATPKPVSIRVVGRLFTIGAREAGVRIDYRAAVDRAIAQGRRGSFLERAWRDLASRSIRADLRAPVLIDAGRLRRAVSRIAGAVRRAPRDAWLKVTVHHIRVRHGRPGLRLAHPARLARRVAAAFRDRHASHRLVAAGRRIPPQVSARDLRRSNAVVVTVSHHEHAVRVFRDLEPAVRYDAVAGTPRHPTPIGVFTVHAKRRHPPWIGFDGRIGFRPAGSRGSGSARAGVRMRRADLRALYRQVDRGVLVGVGP